MESGNRGNRLNGWIFVAISAVFLIILFSGYGLYQNSIGQAVYSTTVSFMEQIADHDRLNIVNQFNSKWEYLNSVLERLQVTREKKLEDAVYELGIESNVSSFEKLYLIMEDGRVYGNNYIETTLKEVAWGELFLESEGNFVAQYSENTREQWGEYLLYGIQPDEPFLCGDQEISGIVGMVPISEITNQMEMESFDGRGVAVVIRPAGEIITASQYYSSPGNKNFLEPLQEAKFQNGVSLEQCLQAIERGEPLFADYSLNGERFYTLFRPLEQEGVNGWYLVVRVSAEVTAEQVQVLLLRSLLFFGLLGVGILAISFFVYQSINAARVARASEQAKSSFLANMSHEIRTPLNGIVGLLYLMRQNLDQKDKLEEYLKKAEVSAEFLKSVITDVLDMSKIESGQLEIYPDHMDLTELLEEIRVILGIQAEERGLRFRVESEELFQTHVLGDPLRVKQILTNLLGNALKFTPEGGEVSLTAGQKLNGNMIDTTFIVADTGCGMSPEFLDRIWTPFEQERRLASQNGTGLGTTISKTLTEKMGGTISVESRLGEGTVFTITIPFSAAQAPAARKAAEEEKNKALVLKGKRILAVEDNEINRMILVSILQEQGCLTDEAVNGQEAVELFERSGIGFYDLILMDIQMPVMNGYDAAQTIRGLSRPDAAAPIFAMTANAFREDVDRALAAGMNDVLTKPLDIALLLEKIRKI